MKFETGTFLSESGSLCVVGALARSIGVSKRTLNTSSLEKIVSRVAKALKLPEKTISSLVTLNDSRHWTALTKRLQSLELVHRVRPYALDTTIKTTKTNQTVLA